MCLCRTRCNKKCDDRRVGHLLTQTFSQFFDQPNCVVCPFVENQHHWEQIFFNFPIMTVRKSILTPEALEVISMAISLSTTQEIGDHRWAALTIFFVN